jgi:hypothetical protein
MLFISSIAILVSAIPILILCIGDPKRRRAAGLKDSGFGPDTRQRQRLSIAACLPGIACICAGEIAAFVLWLGGCALFGWFLAALFQGRTDALKF